jgi:hypothetical protein
MWQKTKNQLKQLSRQNSGFFTANSAENVGISKRTFYRIHDAGEIVCVKLPNGGFSQSAASAVTDYEGGV